MGTDEPPDASSASSRALSAVGCSMWVIRSASLAPGCACRPQERIAARTWVSTNRPRSPPPSPSAARYAPRGAGRNEPLDVGGTYEYYQIIPSIDDRRLA